MPSICTSKVSKSSKAGGDCTDPSVRSNTAPWTGQVMKLSMICPPQRGISAWLHLSSTANIPLVVWQINIDFPSNSTDWDWLISISVILI